MVSFSNVVCSPVNNNFNDGSGKCGPDWGRCNAFLNPKHMYCDIFNEACHDDMDIKIATGNFVLHVFVKIQLFSIILSGIYVTFI